MNQHVLRVGVVTGGPQCTCQLNIGLRSKSRGRIADVRRPVFRFSQCPPECSEPQDPIADESAIQHRVFAVDPRQPPLICQGGKSCGNEIGDFKATKGSPTPLVVFKFIRPAPWKVEPERIAFRPSCFDYLRPCKCPADSHGWRIDSARGAVELTTDEGVLSKTISARDCRIESCATDGQSLLQICLQ